MENINDWGLMLCTDCSGEDRFEKQRGCAPWIGESVCPSASHGKKTMWSFDIESSWFWVNQSTYQFCSSMQHCTVYTTPIPTHTLIVEVSITTLFLPSLNSAQGFEECVTMYMTVWHCIKQNVCFSFLPMISLKGICLNSPTDCPVRQYEPQRQTHHRIAWYVKLHQIDGLVCLTFRAFVKQGWYEVPFNSCSWGLLKGWFSLFSIVQVKYNRSCLLGQL